MWTDISVCTKAQHMALVPHPMAGTLLQAHPTSQLAQGMCLWEEMEVQLPSPAHSVAVVCTQSQELCHFSHLYRAISVSQAVGSGYGACIATYKWLCWRLHLGPLLLCYPFLEVSNFLLRAAPHKHLHACHAALPWAQPAFSPLPSSLLRWGGHAGDAAPAPQGGWVVGNRGVGSKWQFQLLPL